MNRVPSARARLDVEVHDQSRTAAQGLAAGEGNRERAGCVAVCDEESMACVADRLHARSRELVLIIADTNAERVEAAGRMNADWHSNGTRAACEMPQPDRRRRTAFNT